MTITVQCPHCGSTEIVAHDTVIVHAAVSGWKRNEAGELEAEWAGGSHVFWDTQSPADPAEPYACTDCNAPLAAADLIVQED